MRVLTLRKDKPCGYCGVPMQKGDKSLFVELRTPKSDPLLNQKGIDYVRYWLHTDADICNEKSKLNFTGEK